ncbi:MAG: prepilin peptidase, partial [Candidatus Buchananbacteria bacterium]|nr:prepilin peptidase [Candidatus Buchananbacteria bacterium]
MVYLFLLGLIVGSFVNVVIYRIPRGQSVVGGRSQCPNCRKKLPWYDLIPIASFFIVRGRCRNCKKSISWIYPLVELYSGFIFLFSFSLFVSGGLINWLFVVFVLEVLFILALIDLRHLILPDSLLLVLLIGVVVLGVIQRWLNLGSDWQVLNLDNLIGAVSLFGFLFLIWLLSKGKWLGFGDVKLAGIIGLIFGLWGGLIIFYGAIIIGTAVGLILLVSHRAN